MKARYQHAQTLWHRAPDGVRRPVVIEHDSTDPVPLLMDDREESYRRQNGFRPLTSRQLRQLRRQAARTGEERIVRPGADGGTP